MKNHGRAFMTLCAVVVAFLALDDITTDDASTFVFEGLALALCSLWFAHVAYQLWRGHRRSLALVSAGVLALAVLAQRGIGPNTVPRVQFEYVATVGALVWFLAVAAVLAASAWRSGSSHAA